MMVSKPCFSSWLPIPRRWKSGSTDIACRTVAVCLSVVYQEARKGSFHSEAARIPNMDRAEPQRNGSLTPNILSFSQYLRAHSLDLLLCVHKHIRFHKCRQTGRLACWRCDGNVAFFGPKPAGVADNLASRCFDGFEEVAATRSSAQVSYLMAGMWPCC